MVQESRDFEVPHSPAASVTALKAARRAAALPVDGVRDVAMASPPPARPWSTVRGHLMMNNLSDLNNLLPVTMFVIPPFFFAVRECRFRVLGFTTCVK